MAELTLPPPPPAHTGPPVVLATTDKEAKEHEDEMMNTNLWANAKDEKNPVQMHQDVGEIEVNHLQLKEKSELLHKITLQAEKELHEQEKSKVAQKTYDEEKKERYAQAEQVDQQAIDLDHMSFSAQDLNTFSAIADQQSSKNHSPPQDEVKVQTVERHGPKTFFEQIYDKSSQN